MPLISDIHRPPPCPSPRRGREGLLERCPALSGGMLAGATRGYNPRTQGGAPMSCAKCGQVLAEGARFCPSCGAPAGATTGGRPREFHVVGDVMQAVVMPLADGQEVQAEPGALLYMAVGVHMQSRMS